MTFILILIDTQVAFTQIQICEIKFGGRELDKKGLTSQFNSDNPWQKICHQIGVEHDKQGRPENDKPIFACCRDAIGIESDSAYLEEAE